MLALFEDTSQLAIEPPAAPPGLSIRHKCPQFEASPGDFLVSLSRGGNVVQLREVGRPRPGRGGQRGEIRGFSRSSRLNMLRVVHAIDRSAITCTFFNTMTVPRGEGSWPVMERHRRAYLKRFDRKYGKTAFIVWKKERHKSGTVHLHALVFWLAAAPRLKEFREWNDNAWADVVQSSNPWHRKVGCRVELMNSWNGVGHYCAKYLAKDQDGLLEETGRIWGIHNRSLVPGSLDVQHVPPVVGVRARRVLRKLQQRRREKWLIRFDDKWNPVRALPGLSVVDQVATARAAGLRVKRSRPRCMSTVNVQVWASEVGRAKVEPLYEERHTYSPATHFVTEGEGRRVLEWSMARWLDDLESEGDGIPI